MIILTLFGTTRGLELQYFPLADNAPSLKLEDAWIGVTPSQVSLRPDKDAVVVFRRMVGEHLATWIGIYRPAREMGYDRPGSFYGAGAWIIDHVADARLLTESLIEMANQIQANTMNGDSFVKKIADARSEFTPPSRRPHLLASLAEVKLGFKPDGESAFIVENTDAIEVIEWAQRAPSATPFSKAVIGSADQIPSAGQSSAFRVFTSLSLAIDAAYQRLTFEFRNAMSEATNRVQNLTQKLEDLNKANLNLTDDLNDARAALRQAQTIRMQPSEPADPYSGLYLALEEAQSAADMRSHPDVDRWRSQTPTRREYSPLSSGNASTVSAQRRGSGDGRMASAADPGGQAKPHGAARKTYSDEGIDQQPNDLLIIVLAAILALIVAIGVALVFYFKDQERDCWFLSYQCKKETSTSLQKIPAEKAPLSPTNSEQLLGSDGATQRP